LDGATSTIKQGLNIDQQNAQLLRQLQTVKRLKKNLQAQKKKQQQAAMSSSNRVATTQDAAVNKELQELHGQYIQTLREHKTVEANITMAQREYRAHEITNSEIAKLPITEDTRMYRSIGKMFMLSSRDDVNEHLDNAMKSEKKRENDLTQKQEYLERRLKSQQQNIQELAPKQ